MATLEISQYIIVGLFFSIFIIGSFFCIFKKNKICPETGSTSESVETENRETGIQVNPSYEDNENQNIKVVIELPPSYDELFSSWDCIVFLIYWKALRAEHRFHPTLPVFDPKNWNNIIFTSLFQAVNNFLKMTMIEGSSFSSTSLFVNKRNVTDICISICFNIESFCITVILKMTNSQYIIAITLFVVFTFIIFFCAFIMKKFSQLETETTPENAQNQNREPPTPRNRNVGIDVLPSYDDIFSDNASSGS